MDSNNFEIISALIEQEQERLKRQSPQLFRIKNNFPTAYASSVLVRVKERKFLVSAAHILEGTLSGDIQVGNKNAFLLPKIDWHYFEDKNLDLAVMELTGDFENEISKNFEYYDLGIVNPDHQIYMDQFFFAFGYPASKTKMIKTINTLESGVLAYTTNLQKIELCFELGFHPNTHLILIADKKVKSALTQDLGKTPDQNGMSGCGIWHLSRSFVCSNSNPIPFILSGIYIEYHKKKNTSSIVATRISVLTELLRLRFKCDLLPAKKYQGRY